jgi:hypothetical protein
MLEKHLAPVRKTRGGPDRPPEAGNEPVRAIRVITPRAL